MSVSDPLLKSLKGYIIELRHETRPVTDDHPSLQPFCETIEVILRKGLKHLSSILPWNKRDYWHLIEHIGKQDEETNPHHLRLNPTFAVTITSIQKSNRLKTPQGKGRCFIRLGLQKKTLLAPFCYLKKNPHLLETWYDYTSIIGNEILLEILMSLLQEASEINFKLHIRIASFLDDTWIIPAYKKLELVPCKDLGLGVHFVNGWPIVTQVDPEGVAGEDNKVEVGDILEELCGEHLKGCSKPKITMLVQDLQGWPIALSVVKGVYDDGRLFPLAANMLRTLGNEDPCVKRYLEGAEEKAEKSKKNQIPPHALLSDDDQEQVPVQSPEGKARYKVQYLGCVPMGSNGGMVHIEKGVDEVLNATDIVKQDAVIELGEKDVITTLQTSGEQLMHHSYTEISSCGRRIDFLNYFAYIVGNTTCTIAHQFVCHVFEAQDEEECKVILCAIAQGFERTHWFV